MISKQTTKPRKREAASGAAVAVPLQPDSLYRLDAWIKRQKDEPTRPEAIRKLMEQALDALDHANRGKRR